MYPVAIDLLPAQASAVPCERVFSSSKESCPLRRNKISPALLEVLQILKFSYKQDRLDFSSDWVAGNDEFGIDNELTEAEIRELLVAGKIDELKDLISNCGDSWTICEEAASRISSADLFYS